MNKRDRELSRSRSNNKKDYPKRLNTENVRSNNRAFK